MSRLWNTAKSQVGPRPKATCSCPSTSFAARSRLDWYELITPLVAKAIQSQVRRRVQGQVLSEVKEQFFGVPKKQESRLLAAMCGARGILQQASVPTLEIFGNVTMKWPLQFAQGRLNGVAQFSGAGEITKMNLMSYENRQHIEPIRRANNCLVQCRPVAAHQICIRKGRLEVGLALIVRQKSVTKPRWRWECGRWSTV